MEIALFRGVSAPTIIINMVFLHNGNSVEISAGDALDIQTTFFGSVETEHDRAVIQLDFFRIFDFKNRLCTDPPPVSPDSQNPVPQNGARSDIPHPDHYRLPATQQ